MSSVFGQHTDLTLAGGPVRVYRAGDHGPPLLLLHGAMLDTAEGVWRNVVPALATDHRVYAIDLPRHGASRPWQGRLDAAFMVGFLDQLLDELELPQVGILGLSMGGGVGIGYALAHPERVSSLIAIGPGGIGAKRQAQFFTWLVMRIPGLLRWFSKFMARSPKYLRKSMISNLTAGEQTRDFEAIMAQANAEARAKARHGEPALDDWQVDSYGPWRMRLDYLPDLQGLKVPSLWVRGADDPLVGHTEMAAAAAAAPNARMVTVADAGHVVTYDQPDEFNRLAREFLAGLG